MEFIQDRGAFNNYLYQHCHCINAGQSKEERKMKYKLALYFSGSWEIAQKFRDWSPNCFAKHFGYKSWESMIKILKRVAK